MRILKSLIQLRWNITPKARVLFATVAAAGIATLCAVIFLLNASLSLIAGKLNQIDVQRSNDMVNAAVQSGLNQMASITTGSMRWDEAIDHLTGPKIDRTWLYDSWGVLTRSGRPYDGVYVLNDRFNIILGYAQGEVRMTESLPELGPGFAALVDKTRPRLAPGNAAVSGLSRTPRGPAIVTIGPIGPGHDSGRSPEVKTTRYLVMTRHITPQVLTGAGQQFRLDNLHLVEPGAAAYPYQDLKDAADRHIGRLTWTPRLTGNIAAEVAKPRMGQITWLVGTLILLFVLISAYSLQKLARSEKDARNFALTDGLSGLPNRRAIYEHLRDMAKRRDRLDQTVVFIDLDGFKDVNDIYGHNIGDKLIMIVAAALKEFLPADALLVRMGGDEFAMLIGGKDGPERAQAFAQAALDFVAAPIRIGERTVQVGASVGIATGNLKTCRSHELLRRADLAMYRSKATGKGRITVYDCELDAARQHKQALEQGLRDGLKRGEFDVVYQPVVDARTLQVVTVEALVRWPRRPEGPLPPDQFIEIAESSGLIHALGQFVLRQACTDLRGLSQLGLSVNISPAQFRDPEFEHRVGEILQETGFPVDRLELEVTEGYLIENPERAAAAVRNLKALGVSLALDDFGTGYASVGYLRRFHFDRIKIDKSLAGLVDRDPQAAALVAGTVSIANALNIAITAEGVETEDQVKLLKLAGCHHLQGYYFSRPIPLTDIRWRLQAQAPVAIAG